MSLQKRFSRGFKAFFAELTKPESAIKGEEFEDYVRKKMFPSSHYTLIHKTHNFNTNKRDFIETSLHPDFKFRDKENGLEFYVEAKWRSGQYDQIKQIEWCKQNQLDRYLAIDNNKKGSNVFIALGIGDNPKHPERIVLFLVSNCPYPKLYKSVLDKYTFYVDKPVFSNYLWSLKITTSQTTAPYL